MEIKNNTPSFGMAFIKPAANEMATFTTQVTRDMKPKYIAKGLKQLQREHQADKYVDIRYFWGEKGFAVTPKSGLDESTEKITREYLRKTSHVFRQGEIDSPTRLERTQAELEGEMKKCTSKLQLIHVGVKGVLKMAREAFRAAFVSPKEILPGELRAASAKAKNIENRIAKRLESENLIDNSLK